MKDWIDTFLAYTDNTEPPLLYREWVAVSVVASALQRKCFLKWGHLKWYPNLYIVLVAPPGRARKGTAMGDGKQFLTKLGIPLAAEAITREALIRELGKSTDTILRPEINKIIMHSSLTVYSSELAVFLGKNNFQLLFDLTDWFDCADTWTYRTKNQGEDIINGVWVNLLGATTPELIQQSLPSDAIGGGLTSRIIFVFAGNKGKLVPFPSISPEQEKMFDELLIGIEEIKIRFGGFSFTKEYLSKVK